VCSHQLREGWWRFPASVGFITNICGEREGTRVFSAYELRDGIRIWIITEANCSATTILLPEEY
jgi:hypothetical protein